MRRIYDPNKIPDPSLRDLAFQAEWVWRLYGEYEDLEEQCWYGVDRDTDEPKSIDGDDERPFPIADDGRPYPIAREILSEQYEEADRQLEDRLILWIGQDIERFALYHSLAIEPWRLGFGRWRRDTPAWVHGLVTCGGDKPFISQYLPDGTPGMDLRYRQG